MLLYPSVNTLQEKTDSRYSLVILTAKRARDLIDGKPALTEEQSERPVSQAAKEIAGDMITYTRKEHHEPEFNAANEIAAEPVQDEASDTAVESAEDTAEKAEEETASEEAEAAETL